MKQIEIVAKDYKGLKLCDSCWNSNHYIYDKPVIDDTKPHSKAPSKNAVKKSNCIGPPL